MKKLLVLCSFLLFISAVNSQEYDAVISNSANWQDVYSVMQYAATTGKTGYFLVSTRHSTLLINQLSRQSSTYVVSSRDSPFVVGYDSVLRSRGISEVDELRSATVNLDLARELPDEITHFIIVDDSYGYNAISVAPYAAIKKGYVLFANRRNINQVTNYLDTRQIDEIIIYGQLDREVKNAIQAYEPTVISEGDRFRNNQRIVDLYQEEHTRIHGEPKRQAILTNGEFIEQEIMSGVEPVIFIGRANVPDQVADYVRASDIDIGILIGNELVGAATFIRRQLGISVFVKFAQSARQPSSAIQPVEDLDRFYLPRYILEIDVFSVVYNRVQNWIEVTYQNNKDLAAYLSGSITIRHDGGTIVLGDEEAVFIDKSQFKTIIYREGTNGPIPALQGDATAEIFTIYGESPQSLEYQLQKTVAVDEVSITDNSRIEFGEILYDRRSNTFLIEIRNVGDVDTFVDVEIIDLLINDELVTLGGDEVIFIPAGESDYVEVTTEMDETDVEENPQVTVRAYYGERERNLIYTIEDTFTYEFTGLGYMTGAVLRDVGRNALLYSPALVIIILLILILGMKKKCPNCGQVNNLRSKQCKRCGQKI